ncbi:hypothetical protein FHU37_001539 [Allostreptomyces psammosilenae]|uniref:Uncharacterized protein n=1 Tax=Allostreptomyces psammosilenae TaxID=1892865 RepID=A0A852ZQ78_9ACTN|nr:hypothetical protein [Allostreptomyces psammosilenae]
MIGRGGGEIPGAGPGCPPTAGQDGVPIPVGAAFPAAPCRLTGPGDKG